MKFAKFEINNFKGIEHVVFDLEKSPDANIFTLVGLNESGKTTILEALNFFDPNIIGIKAFDLPGAVIKDYNSIIPISKRDNFNEKISIILTVKLEKSDFDLIDKYVIENTPFGSIKRTEYITFYRHYEYENSKYVKSDYRWTGVSGVLKSSKKQKYIFVSGDEYKEENLLIGQFCINLIPSIIYFPNFLFDFPSRILLQKAQPTGAKEQFYIDLVQDILDSLENGTTISTHLIDRINSTDGSDKKNLDRLIQKMERKVTDIIFEAWNRIFKRKIKDTRVIISQGKNGKGLAYLEFEIEAQDGIYQINERSLGFRWFFTFLLFTQFRTHRKNNPKNVIYLFDEPASNLHSYAQQLLLESFGNLMKDCKIIYTTHSHHLINPNWLESTYVVKNEGLRLEDPESYNIKQTNITIQRYRDFANRHPNQIAYFQPILDVLDYAPSNLENIPDCVLVEGKNDYYVLSYFNKIIFEEEYDVNYTPGMGAGSLDSLISLYIGWGRNFIILLDSDKEGDIQKTRYIDKFGLLLVDKIFTLEDINVEWKKKGMEKIFQTEDALLIQKHCFKDSDSFNKTQFNRAVQECLINKTVLSFSDQTNSNFERIIEFLAQKSQSDHFLACSDPIDSNTLSK